MSGNERLVELGVDGEGYRVRLDDAALAERLSRWARQLSMVAGPGVEVRLVSRSAPPRIELEDSLWQTFDTPEDLLLGLERLLYERLVRPGRGRAVAHAAVLARASGAVLFLGESGAGKSVLSARLVQRGWRYLSDEFAPIDSEGKVHPVPRPITFLSDELPEPLWRQLSSAGEHWALEFDTPAGKRRAFRLLPGTEPATSALPVRAIYRLEPRRGGAPRLHRFTPSELRAWVYGHARLAAGPAAER